MVMVRCLALSHFSHQSSTIRNSFKMMVCRTLWHLSSSVRIDHVLFFSLFHKSALFLLRYKCLEVFVYHLFQCSASLISSTKSQAIGSPFFVCYDFHILLCISGLLTTSLNHTLPMSSEYTNLIVVVKMTLTKILTRVRAMQFPFRDFRIISFTLQPSSHRITASEITLGRT